MDTFKVDQLVHPQQIIMPAQVNASLRLSLSVSVIILLLTRTPASISPPLRHLSP